MDESFTFAQISDPHLTNLEGVRCRDLLNKRILGYLSWRLSRRHEHRSEILDALIADLQHTQPRHVVVTGDLTHIGLPGEFHQAQKWLQTLGPPEHVSVIPGNHDAYVATPWEQTYSQWAPYMAGDAAAPPTRHDPQSLFPSLRHRGPVAFIGLSTARPSLPFLAVGSLGEDQLQRLAQILAETGRQGRCRVVLIHHPPLPGAVKPRKHLTDSRQLQAVLAQHGAELVLHGHTHYTTWMEMSCGDGTIPVIGIPSASAMGHKPGRRAQYYLYRITPRPWGWDIAVSIRGAAPEGQFTQVSETSLKLTRPHAFAGTPQQSSSAG